ncbi:MAG: peptidase M48, partial [Burkholderiales bacterium]|nr:peptidase M48 [Burkholderiales bacterium]
MRFRQLQEHAHAQTFKLFAWFALLLVGLTVAVNLFLALVYKMIMPFAIGYPALFFETNTAVVVLFILGGSYIETQRLREGGGPRIAHWMG